MTSATGTSPERQDPDGFWATARLWSGVPPLPPVPRVVASRYDQPHSQLGHRYRGTLRRRRVLEGGSRLGGGVPGRHRGESADGSTTAAELDRLLGLGATRVDIGQGSDVSWIVLADPGGNEFCLLRRTVQDVNGTDVVPESAEPVEAERSIS
jgi:hypothetical protein